MSTRGAIGLRLGGEDKVTYNHSDSYPTWLGKKMLEFIHDTSIADLTGAYNRLTLVYEEIKPTKTQVKVCVAHGAGRLPKYSVQDPWRCLLYGEEGEPAKWLTGTGLMLEYSAFLASSLFCEWAYIVNLDERTLEVYCGGNQNPNAAGRYAVLDDGDDWNGVVLVDTLPFAVIQEMTPEMIADYVTRLEGR